AAMSAARCVSTSVCSAAAAWSNPKFLRNAPVAVASSLTWFLDRPATSAAVSPNANTASAAAPNTDSTPPIDCWRSAASDVAPPKKSLTAPAARWNTRAERNPAAVSPIRFSELTTPPEDFSTTFSNRSDSVAVSPNARRSLLASPVMTTDMTVDLRAIFGHLRCDLFDPLADDLDRRRFTASERVDEERRRLDAARRPTPVDRPRVLHRRPVAGGDTTRADRRGRPHGRHQRAGAVRHTPHTGQHLFGAFAPRLFQFVAQFLVAEPAETAGELRGALNFDPYFRHVRSPPLLRTPVVLVDQDGFDHLKHLGGEPGPHVVVFGDAGDEVRRPPGAVR